MSSELARLVNRTRLTWYRFTALVSLTLVLLALATVYLDGMWEEFFSADLWRGMLFTPAILAYMLAIIPPLSESTESAFEALQPLVHLDDEGYDQLLREASGTTPRGELITLSIGAGIGILAVVLSGWEGGLSWIGLYWILANPIVTSLLAWCLYVAFAGSKPVSVIHRHLSDVDPFDLRPFEPIGRHSLWAALAFVGGGAISVLFQFGVESFLDPGFLISHGILVAIAVSVFFLSMRHTHRVLAQAKGHELASVQDHIVAAYRSVAELEPGSQELNTLSTKLGFWQEYEKRVKAARTWPYDLGMLRTLFLSVLTPVGISLAQRLIGLLFS